MTPVPDPGWAGRTEIDHATTVSANRTWWDDQAAAYHEEHGDFLGDAGFVWGPEGWTEAELDLLQLRPGHRVLELGGGAGQCARWVVGVHPEVQIVSTDLSGGMLAVGRTLNARHGMPLPLAQCDATGLPFAEASFDRVFTAYGAVPFVADSARLMREVARVLRPGGRFVFATTHPIRWAFPDVPGPEGLTATMSYFDRTPYAEVARSGAVTYAEHHRTLGDRIRELVEAGMDLLDLVEPEWPARNEATWGGWSPVRGRLLPGTAIFVAERRDRARGITPG